jgi:tetratricopeptide (TPR) repeat protein
MQIGTDYSTSAAGVLLGTTSATAATSAAQPVFGPPTQVSLNENTPTFTGFRDYTQLGVSGLWQFDLASVLNPPTGGYAETARSADEQKADEAAVKSAFDAINVGQYDAARTLMNGLLADNPNNAAAVQALGYADLSQGNYGDAEQLFLKAHALNPTAGYDHDAQNARILQGDDETVLARARAMVATPGQRDEGIRILITLTQRSPKDTAAHMLLADSLFAAGEGPNGLLEFSTAIRNADHTQLGQLESRLKQLGEENPSSAYIQQLVGKAQLGQERYDDAIVTLTRAQNMADTTIGYSAALAEAHIGVGRELLATGDVSGALARFQQAHTLDPTGRETQQALAEGYTARGAEYARLGNFSSAADDYRRVADMLAQHGDQTLSEHAAGGAYAAGRALERQRIAAGTEIDSEALAFQAAYDLAPDNLTYKRQLADTRNAIGDELSAAGKYEDAAQAYARAHELFTYDRTYRDNAVQAYVAYADDRLYNLNYDDAIEAYAAAFKIDTTNAGTKQKLADAYTARGLDYASSADYTKAVADFKAALHLFPDNSTYQTNYNSVAPWDT